MIDLRRLMNRMKKGFFDTESGAVAVHAAIGRGVLMGSIDLSLDIARLVSVKRELVSAAEAGALSGARGLGLFNLPAASDRDPNWSNAEIEDNGLAPSKLVQ